MRKALALLGLFAAGAAAVVLFRPATPHVLPPASLEGPVSASATAPATGRDAAGFRAERRMAVSPEVSLFAVGDVMPGRGVARAAARHEEGWIFSAIDDAIRGADIAFANLEAPVIAGAQVPDDSMRLRADPGVERTLSDAGFDVLSVANNHAMDQGADGLLETIARLQGEGMRPIGSGSDAPSARAPAVFEVRGIKIAFLAYVDPAFTRAKDRAAEERPGVAFMDPDAVADDVRAAAADVVIVSMHAGEEYADEATPAQRRFAHAAIDGGADLVIGHHPHVIQAFETYKGKPILYSLGNLVFDQGWSDDTGLGMAADIRLGREGVRRIVWRPIAIADSGQPSFAQGTRFTEGLSRLGDAARRGLTAFSALPSDGPGAQDVIVDGQALSVRSEEGRLTIASGTSRLWSSPDDWWIDSFRLADLDRDGRTDLAMSVWKPGNYGSSKPFWAKQDDAIRNHFFLFRIAASGASPIWQSSNLAAPNCWFEAADLDGDGFQELAVGEGAYAEGSCETRHLAAWGWSGWGFENLWRDGIW